MQLRCCLFARKQRLLFESPALFEGVNIIRMGVNIVRMHIKYGLDYIFQCLVNHTNRYRIDVFKFLSYT